MSSTKTGRRARLIAALIGCFYAGAIADWWLREKAAPPTSAWIASSSRSDREAAHPIATIGGPTISAAPPAGEPGGPVADLYRRDLRIPIDGTDVARLKGSFVERRSGDRGHEAVDILAPRNTPIHAVEDGSVAKLFFSKAGGNTVYQFDPTERFCYYYAHLERYADGLHSGQRVARGDVIGYVGTSGNAPPGTPHLHFAVFELTEEKHWWQGHAVDPYLVFHH